MFFNVIVKIAFGMEIAKEEEKAFLFFPLFSSKMQKEKQPLAR